MALLELMLAAPSMKMAVIIKYDEGIDVDYLTSHVIGELGLENKDVVKLTPITIDGAVRELLVNDGIVITTFVTLSSLMEGELNFTATYVDKLITTDLHFAVPVFIKRLPSSLKRVTAKEHCVLTSNTPSLDDALDEIIPMCLTNSLTADIAIVPTVPPTEHIDKCAIIALSFTPYYIKQTNLPLNRE